MNIIEATLKAKEILNANPSFILTGSLSLMLAGVLKPRDIGDLDFTVQGSQGFNPQGYTAMSYGASVDGVITYQMGEATEFHYQVFVRKDNSDVETREVFGIKIQVPYETLHWKRKMNRQKDIIDLQF